MVGSTVVREYHVYILLPWTEHNFSARLPGLPPEVLHLGSCIRKPMKFGKRGCQLITPGTWSQRPRDRKPKHYCGARLRLWLAQNVWLLWPIKLCSISNSAYTVHYFVDYIFKSSYTAFGTEKWWIDECRLDVHCCFINTNGSKR